MSEHEARPSQAAGGERGRFAALSRLAAHTLFFERLWPPLVWAFAIAVLFLAVSWLGLWLFAPREIRIGGVVLFGLAVVAALAPLARLRWPAGRDVTARLDRDAGAEHRPATSLADSLANDKDPVARALWIAHQSRLARALEGVRVKPPAPGMPRRDPFALRFAVALIAFAAAVAAGPELYGRFSAAFDWRGGALAVAAMSRIDAWIDPPPYAGRPPVVIDFKAGAPQTLAVFEDSTLTVRGAPGVVDTRVEGPIAPADPKGAAPQSPERRWTIHGPGKVTILRGGSKAAEVTFAVNLAGAPTIALTEQPRANLSGSLTLAYHIDDRYGVTSARADFALKRDPDKPAQRTLALPPQAGLETPATEKGVGDAKTTADLSEHPWAGARVTMTLTAVSVSGKTGSSEPVEVTLPERLFRNPLARALVEERRNLILDPDHAPPRVATALTGLSVAPELFDTPASVYLGLKEANSRLANAKGDADLLDVAALLWAMAQQIEDGDATQAERDLRAAEQALREALQRGASEEELKRLMQNLRDAAKRFASEMAKNDQARQQDQQESQEQAQDLDKLMDQLEDAARNGTREEAEAMLDQMQQMFENMRTADNAQESPEERALKKQIDELSKLLRDQQALRDDTFKSDQHDQARKHGKKHGQPGQETPGQDDQAQQGGDNPPSADKDQNGDESAKQGDQEKEDSPSLEQRQRALRDRLAELQRKLKSLGMKGEKGFDEAQKHMQEAEGDLKGDQQGSQSGEQPGQQQQGGGKSGKSGKGGKGAAVEEQGRALEAMREGAQGMQKQMNQQGQGQGRGKGYSARRRRPGEQVGDDPLGRGREEGNLGRENGSLRELGGREERARRVLEELRRRLADPSRPTGERDYLERLTKPN